MVEEPGGMWPDHSREGRSWRGYQYHACLAMLDYGFLALEERSRSGKKGGAEIR
jgi:hypothetical protein